MKQKLREIAAAAAGVRPDALMIGGAACISLGAGLIYTPAGWIVGGLFLMLAGLAEAGSRK